MKKPTAEHKIQHQASSPVAEFTSKSLAKYTWLRWFFYFLALSLLIITGYLCILTPHGQIASWILASIYALSAISIAFLTYDLVNVGHELTDSAHEFEQNIRKETKNLQEEKGLETQFEDENK